MGLTDVLAKYDPADELHDAALDDAVNEARIFQHITAVRKHLMPSVPDRGRVLARDPSQSL
jgi:hypothetical protein